MTAWLHHLWPHDWSLAWPWLLWAIPLAWLAWILLPVRQSQAAALKFPDAEALARVEDGAAGIVHRGAPWLAWLAWTLLCIAAARPQSLGPAVLPPSSGRGMMLAVDLSGSMETPDMALGNETVDRLTAAKAVMSDFLDRRGGDRVGLIVFGDRAFVLAPITADLATVRQQLRDSVVGLPGTSTALGDAIALAVKRLRAVPAQERVLILLTDGVATAGVIEPLKAAELAQIAGVRVYTIGVGGGELQQSFFGIPVSTSGGDDEVDEATLQKVAQLTGGRYYRARDARQLSGIYGEIERLEPVKTQGKAIRPRIEHYFPLLLAACGLFVLAFAINAWRRRG
ncbi:vWA domain-containing protein [Solilutibacter silvestris]|uniref:von Willebrand factor type A domain-containing protein n=1 Tax=Solilutibacter silvestris TaxID=1645665 RepID=A0A2K1PX37_9GAMM|nr:VWA domain-containing protein [Lysobacter silvestris]PNS07355.1 von Willebrand factor type A domain-containing protein [Lysobacter silvestris]